MIDLSKSVFVDVGNQYDTFIGGKNNTLSQQTVYLVQGDILTLKVYLRNVTGDNTTAEETLQSDESLIVGVKEVSSLAGDDGGLFVYQSAFASQTDTDGDTFYEGVVDLTNSNLTTALADKRNAECIMEFSVQKNDGTFGKSFQGSLVITSELSPSGSGASLGSGGGGLGGGGDTSLLTQMLNSLRAEVGTWADYLEGKGLAQEETEYTLPDADGDGIVDVADDDYIASPSVGVTNLVATEEAEQLVSSNSPTNLVALTQPQEGVSSLEALTQPSEGVSALEALTQPGVGVTNLEAEEEEAVPFTAPASSFRSWFAPFQTTIGGASYVGTNGKYYVMDGSQGWDEIVDDSNSALTGITGMLGKWHVVDGDGKVYGADPQFHPTNSRGGYNELTYLQGFEFIEGSREGRVWGANGDGKLYANPMLCYYNGFGGTGERPTNANDPLYVEADFVPSRPVVTMTLDANGVHQYTELDNIVWAKNTGNGHSAGLLTVVTSEGKGYYEKWETGVWNGNSNHTVRSYMVPIMEDASTEMTGIEQATIGQSVDTAGTFPIPNITILKTDGTVWCQGSNLYGQTGQDTDTPSAGTAGATVYPAQVIDASGGYVTGASKVVSGIHTNFALKDDGTVLFWGWNRYLVGGTGGTNNNARELKATPMHSSSAGATLTGVEDITEEFDYGSFFFKKTDGTIWMTGSLSNAWESDIGVFYNTTGHAVQIV